MPLPSISPMPLRRLREPFDHHEWLYEIKWDGFRALAYIEDGECRLISRNGNAFKSFSSLAQLLPRDVKPKRAILDGEIVCLDRDGRSNFYNLLYRRAEPHFYAFDLLWADGEDLRYQPLHERKLRLKGAIAARTSRLLYVDHIVGRGEELFRLACERDLEGIVAKWMYAPYTSGGLTSWVKVKNARYSQLVGRDEAFERMHERSAAIRERQLWDVCAMATAPR